MAETFPAKSHFIREGEGDEYLGCFVLDLIASEDTGEQRFAIYLDEDLGIQWWVLDKDGRCLLHDSFADNFCTVLNNVVHLETISGSLLPPLFSTNQPTQETHEWVLAKIRIAELRRRKRECGQRAAGLADGPEKDAVLVERKKIDDELRLEEKAAENGAALHLDKLRRANPLLRATRRLIAEALARTYIPPEVAPKDEDDKEGKEDKDGRELAELREKAKDARQASRNADQHFRRLLKDNTYGEDLSHLHKLCRLQDSEAKLAEAEADEHERRDDQCKQAGQESRYAHRCAAGRAAENCLHLAKNYLCARSRDLARMWMISGALCMLVATLLIWAGSYNHHATTYRDPATSVAGATGAPGETGAAPGAAEKDKPPELKEPANTAAPAASSKAGPMCWVNKEAMNIILCSCIGALGAMLSLLLKTGDRDYDSGAGRLPHMLEGATRIIVGILGACFAALILKSGFLDHFLNKDLLKRNEESFASLQLLLGFVAGVSERLVPSFISIFEAQVQTPETLAATEAAAPASRK